MICAGVILYRDRIESQPHQLARDTGINPRKALAT